MTLRGALYRRFESLLSPTLLHRGWAKVMDYSGLQIASLLLYSPDVNNSHDVSSYTFEEHGRLAIAKLIKSGSIGLELGVAAGHFSNLLLSSDKVKELYGIDAWADHHNDHEFLLACAKLSKYGVRSHVLRGFFDQFLHVFPDNFFDFIYFDAYAHTGQLDGKLFQDWYPKLKEGGLCCGHDYDLENWPKTYHAVNEFAERLDRKINIIPCGSFNVGEDRFPSWYFCK
jgi:hypothetical protein